MAGSTSSFAGCRPEVAFPTLFESNRQEQLSPLLLWTGGLLLWPHYILVSPKGVVTCLTVGHRLEVNAEERERVPEAVAWNIPLEIVLPAPCANSLASCGPWVLPLSEDISHIRRGSRPGLQPCSQLHPHDPLHAVVLGFRNGAQIGNAFG